MNPAHYKSLVSDPVRQFADAIYADTGAVVSPIADGDIHRFNDPKGKPRNGACWYVLHLDGLPAGGYGNWRTGEQRTWRANAGHCLSSEEREKADRVIEAAMNKRKADRDRRHAFASGHAANLWRNGKPASANHPYLVAKGIRPQGLRQSAGALLVPLRTIDGDLVNIQRIAPDGTKRFLKGGRVWQVFHIVGAKSITGASSLYIAEGIATACTASEALGVPVIAALNAGNLTPVAKALRTRFPLLEIVIAADNDWRTSGNPGITKAREVAAAVNGAVTWPSVCMKEDCTCTDFNDLERCRRSKS